MKLKTSKQPLTAAIVYYGSSSGASYSFYRRLEKKGGTALLAANLLRLEKTSCRAKGYRGGITHSDGQHTSYRRLANKRIEDYLMGISNILIAHKCGLSWGWKHEGAGYVLYIDLPQGQFRFDSRTRYRGPDYLGEWDGEHKNEERIIAFADSVLATSLPDSTH